MFYNLFLVQICFGTKNFGGGDLLSTISPAQEIDICQSYVPGNLSGDLHFDADENWTLESESGTNLLQAAVHELGHSLGLGHSYERDAVMYPVYREYQPHLKLHEDDIAGIQALYGPPKSQPENKDSIIWSPCQLCNII